MHALFAGIPGTGPMAQPVIEMKISNKLIIERTEKNIWAESKDMKRMKGWGKGKALRCGFGWFRQVPSRGHQHGSSDERYQDGCLLAKFLVHLKHVNLLCVEDRF